ncbi:MAG TPA: hypothetical protein VKR55_11335 [Bradyrhizobium sp.]|uniref:hypothetical protein n=1 Tax=Bradyrhizobium sp. TaxID=376 RepID=UPI002CC7612F|nr:hypothetical protein [Bradyrhizobium sp.]HLZ02729.1 hypothetical protein [Bradyrhizobium sp.]
MAEAEPGKVEGANKALDGPNRIICSNIVLNPRRKQAGLIPALAGLEWAIRHEPNRTSIAANAEFLPSLDEQYTPANIKRRRHSGAARRAEPGIHNHSRLWFEMIVGPRGNNNSLGLWIPGSRLRRAPE